jgi:cytochrome P450
VYNKLQSEIRLAFPDLESIKHGSALTSCKYLLACIDETLRISPPAGQALWREVRERGLVIDGEILPPGYDVGVSSYVLHHNVACHKNPFEFIPERWMVDEDAGTSSEDVARAKSVFIPFSLGSRNCIGKNLAYRELQLTLATVIWLYDFRVASDPKLAKVGEGRKDLGFGRQREDEFQVKQHFTAWRDGPWLEFRQKRA